MCKRITLKISVIVDFNVKAQHVVTSVNEMTTDKCKVKPSIINFTENQGIMDCAKYGDSPLAEMCKSVLEHLVPLADDVAHREDSWCK